MCRTYDVCIYSVCTCVPRTVPTRGVFVGGVWLTCPSTYTYMFTVRVLVLSSDREKITRKGCGETSSFRGIYSIDIENL